MIATFDTDVKNDEMIDLVRKMTMVAFQDVTQDTKVAVTKMFEDEVYTPGRRRVVPEEITAGRRVYALDLMMLGDYLPTDTLEFPLIPCMAEPGETGTIQMLPWWIVDRASATSEARTLRRCRNTINQRGIIDQWPNREDIETARRPVPGHSSSRAAKAS